MTPAKRRPATPANPRPARAAKKDSTQLLGPDGEPIAEEAPTGAGGDSAPPTEAGHAAPVDRAAPPSPGRSRALHPERVWPD